MTDDLINALKKEQREDADTIEALRAENARLRGQKEGWKGLQAGTSDIVKQLEAENARLRDALNKIARVADLAARGETE